MKKLVMAAAVAACVVLTGGEAPMAGDATDFFRVELGQEHWVPYPGDGAQFGVQEAFIYGDPKKPGLYVIRLKFPAGVMSSPHSHPETRLGTVLKGTWWTGTGETFDPKTATPIHVGGLMVHPAGKVHYDGARNEELVLQMMGVGPTGKNTVVPGAPGFIRLTPEQMKVD